MTPTLQEFMAAAKERIPDADDRDLRRYWSQNFSTVDPRTLPAWSEFLPAAREKLPNAPESDLRTYWEEQFGDFGAAEHATPPSSLLRRAADVPVGIAKGITDLPGMVRGLADIPTGGAVTRATQAILDIMGREADQLGLPPWARPSQWSSELAALYSPETQAAMRGAAEETRKSIEASKAAGEGTAGEILAGVTGTAKGIVKHPASVIPLITENLPQMGVIAKGTALALKPFSAALNAEVVAGTKTVAEANAALSQAAIRYASAGEGLMAAGQVSSQISELNPEADFRHRLAAVLAGVTTAAITRGVAKIPGLGDIEASMAAKSLGGSTMFAGSLPERIAKGMIAEGLLQELPQSAQEQLWQNLATGRPWQEGIGEQAVQGLIAGGVLGAGGAALSGAPVASKPPARQPEDQPPSEPSGSTQPPPPPGQVGPQLPQPQGPYQPEPLGPYRPTIKDILAAPSVDEAIRAADDSLRSSFEIPSIRTEAPAPGQPIPILPRAEPAPEPLIQPVTKPMPRREPELSPVEAIAQERARIAALRRPAAPEPSPETGPHYTEGPLQSAADLAYPPEERGRLPTQQELLLRQQRSTPRGAYDVPRLEGQTATPSVAAIQPGQAFTPRQPTEPTPQEMIQTERARLLAMRQTQPSVAPAPEPTAPPIESEPGRPLRTSQEIVRARDVDEVRQLAEAKGFAWQSPLFREYAKAVTGTSVLDALSPIDLVKLADALSRIKSPTLGGPTPSALTAQTPASAPTPPPAQAPATEPVPLFEATSVPPVQVQTTATEPVPPMQAAQVPRSALPPEQNAEVLARAEKAQADLEIAGLERGGRYFLETQGQGGTLEVRGLKSPTAGWYKEATSGPGALSRQRVETAIAKIIRDQGLDTGKDVQRVKQVLLQDREFARSPFAPKTEAEWTQLIAAATGQPPQPSPTPGLATSPVSAPLRGQAPETLTTEAAPTTATIDEAAHEAATSPTNARPEPTEPQKETGIYKKGHLRINGLDISIENPAGSERHGVVQTAHYGYIRSVSKNGEYFAPKGNDKEHVDIFVQVGTPESYDGPVFIVDQNKPGTKNFDEHKTVLGPATAGEARALYLSNYAPDWTGFRSIKAFTMPEFKLWLKSGKKQNPVGIVRPDKRQAGAASKSIPLVPNEEPTQAVKEPWQMTALEYTHSRIPASLREKITQPQRTFEPQHRKEIRAALDRGEQVPERVLADYPDLKPATPAGAVPFALAAQAITPSKPKEEGRQISLEIPPETIGTRPLIGREPTPEEAPLFSKAAQEPEPEQTALPEQPEPAQQALPAEEAATPTTILANALRTAADQIEGKPTGKIEDVGSKIGGARKDLAEKTGPKTRAEQPKTDVPGWRKRYTIAQVVSEGADKGKWIVRDTRDTDFAGRARPVGKPFATQAEAEAALPLIAVSRNHRIYKNPDGRYAIYRLIGNRKRAQVVGQTFDTELGAQGYLNIHAEDIIEAKTNFGEEILPRPETVTRTGPERRNGRDVQAEDFRTTFGFRAVEFGNWQNQAERQDVMNHAYDGLLDLAETLGIPPKAIGLNGGLALAFGARGQGLTGARAHYERAYGVINLTKMKGAGSLAHEWFHATDHYFGQQDTKASRERVLNERGDLVYKTTSAADFASYGFSKAGSQVRPEVREAYDQLIRTMHTKAEQFVEDAAKAERFVGEARSGVEKDLKAIRDDDWIGLSKQRDARYRKRNNAPATAEQLAAFDAIAERILNGELFPDRYQASDLANKSKRNLLSGRWTNDALEQISAIYKAVRGRSGFGSGDQRGPLDDLRTSMKFYSARLKMLADAQQGTEKTKQVPTSYAMEAKSLDQGRGEAYWMTNHEMAARAFSAYVEDQLKAQGRQSDFITYKTQGAVLTPWGWKKPYPEGAERTAINGAFDRLFAVIETKETEQGTALFEPREGATGEPSMEQFAEALRQGLPISGTAQRLIDSSNQYPQDLMHALSTRRYVRQLTRELDQTFTAMKRMLTVSDHRVQAATLAALSPDDYYLGVNLRGPDQVILNPWGALWTAERYIAKGPGTPGSESEYTAGVLVRTLLHELTHQQVTTTHKDARADQFKIQLDRNRDIVGVDRLAMMQRRLMEILTGGPNGILAALRTDLRQQQAFWREGDGLSDVARPGTPESTPAFHRQNVAGEGTRGRTGPPEDLRGRRASETAALDARATLQRSRSPLDPQFQPVYHGTPHIWAPEPGFPHGRPRLDKIALLERNGEKLDAIRDAEEQAVAFQRRMPDDSAILPSMEPTRGPGSSESAQIPPEPGRDITTSTGPLTFYHASPARLPSDPVRLKLSKPNESGWIEGYIPDVPMLSGTLHFDQARYWAMHIKREKKQAVNVYSYQLPADVSDAIRDWLRIWHEAWEAGKQAEAAGKDATGAAVDFLEKHQANQLRNRYGFEIEVLPPHNNQPTSPDDWLVREIRFFRNPWESSPNPSSPQPGGPLFQRRGPDSDLMTFLSPRTPTDTGTIDPPVARARLSTVETSLRPSLLGALTLDQLAQTYGQEHQEADRYNRAAQTMEADFVEITREADPILKRWDRLKAAVADRMAGIMEDARREQYDPDPAPSEGRRGAPVGPVTAAERSLRERFDQLPDEAKTIYREVRDFYTHLATWRFEAIRDRIQRAGGTPENRKALLDRLHVVYEQLKAKVYFPFTRFGEYLVIAKQMQHGQEVDRNVQAFESPGEAQKFATLMRGRGWSVKQTTAKAYTASKDIGTSKAMRALLDIVDDMEIEEDLFGPNVASMKDQLKHAIDQLSLQSLPDMSYAKHFIHAKEVPGWSKDQLRAFAHSALHGAHHISRIRNADLMTQALTTLDDRITETETGDTTEARQVYNELLQRHDQILNPKTHPVSAWLGQLGFTMSLGGVVATGVTNLTQVPLITFPWLGARYGFTQSAAALARAYTDFLDPSTLNADSLFDASQSPQLTEPERQMLRELQRRGRIDLTQTMDLAGRSAQDNLSRVAKQYGTVQDKLMRMLGFTFHAPEVMNRQVTALATYRLAIAQGVTTTAATEIAERAITETHFIYEQGNRARFMTGNVMRVLTMFKQYPQHIAFLYGRSAAIWLNRNGATTEERKTARNQLLSMLSLQFAAAGALGMPFLGSVASLVTAALQGFGDDDEQWDWEVELRKQLADRAGKWPAEVLAHGVSRLTPWDMAARLGQDDLFFRAPAREREGRAAAIDWATSVMGPVAGYAVNAFLGVEDLAKGIREANAGHFLRGVEELTPAAIRHGVRTLRYQLEGGVRTRDQYKQLDLTGYEKLGQFFGFAPARTAEMYESMTAIKNREHRIDLRKRELLDRFAAATQDRDAEARQKVLADIREFNQRHRGEFEPITGDTLAKSLRGRIQHEHGVKEGIYLPRRRAGLREEGQFANL